MAKDDELPAVYQEELTRLAYEAQGYTDQSRAMQQQLMALQAAIGDLRGAMEALRNLDKASEGIMVPLGAGVMMKAKLINEGKVLLDVGSGFLAEKTIPDTLTVLEQRLKKTEEVAETAQKSLSDISLHLSELDARAKTIIEKGRGKV